LWKEPFMSAKTKKNTVKEIVKQPLVTEKKKVSKTWLALMKGKQYGEIVDLKAVLR
jgi:hypothetical protein